MELAFITRATIMALDPKQLRELVIRPALMEMEPWSEAAEELVLDTVIVESRLSFIKQLGSGLAFGPLAN